MWKQASLAFILALRLMSGTAIAGLVTNTATASELHFFEHNMSVIAWGIVGDHIQATYQTPRPGLLETGVKQGTVLFEGEYDGGKIMGTAYAFKSGCPPTPYQVLGAQDDKKITLRGPGPVHENGSCKIKGYSLNSPHSTLIFIYSSTSH